MIEERCASCEAPLTDFRPQVVCRLCAHHFCARCQSWSLGADEICERCEVQPSQSCNCSVCMDRRNTEQTRSRLDNWLS